jgi:hypothetical protein
MAEFFEARANWERLSKMSVINKINRELGRAWTFWKISMKEPWTEEIKIAVIDKAEKFFMENPMRTVMDAVNYKDILETGDKIHTGQLGSLLYNSAIQNLLVNSEGWDLNQLNYPYHCDVIGYPSWLTLEEQLERMNKIIKEEKSNNY